MVNINLKYNFGFKWFQSSTEQVFVKGYLFDENDNLLKGHNLALYCSNIKDEKVFEHKILNKKGAYVIIIKTDVKVYIVADAVRTFPLFYAVIEGEFIISDCVETIQKKYDLNSNIAAEQEFLMTGFVTRNNTLVENVSQIQAGEVLKYSIVDGNIKSRFYTNYLTKLFFDVAEEDRIDFLLVEHLEKALDRMLKFAQGRPFLVPLSGGYDSRLIACMLKKKGVKNVICYTYGSKDSYEVSISKQVSKELNYKWIFIEYNEEIVSNNYLNNEDFKEYYKFASNNVSAFLLQDYFAVKEIKKKKLAPNNSIVVPGHSADFLAGSHLSLNNIKNKDRNQTIKNIYNKHYILNEKSLMDEKRLSYLYKIQCNIEFAVDDNWNLQERQSKFIVNSVRIYEYFDFQHYLLFWDLELINFFKKVPSNEKLNTKLYTEVIFSHYFTHLKVDFYKKTKTLKKVIKNILNKFISNDKLEFIRKKVASDFNKTKLMESPIKEDLDGFGSYLNINSLIVRWYLKNK